MNNKETLQDYNTKLIKNNTNLDTVLDIINNLPTAGSGEDISEELVDYDTKLVAQESVLKEIVTALENKGGTSSSSSLNIFIQEEEPATYDGVWIKKESEDVDTISIVNIDTTGEWHYDIGNVPIATAYNRVVKYENYLYSFGGRNSSGTTINNAYKYDLNTNTYSNISSLPVKRQGMSIGIVGTNVFIIGGHDDSGRQSTSYKYDILNDTYTQIASLPTVLTLSSYAVVGTDIYILGGETASGVVAYCYKYNTLTNEYSSLTNLPQTLSNMSCCYDGDDTIYIMGGNPGSGSTYTKNCYKYSVSNNSFTQIASLPNAVGHNATAYIDGFVYMFSGYNNGGKNYLYKYDPTADSFSTLNSITKAFFNSGYTYENDVAYLVSGQSTSGYLSTISTYGLVPEKTFDDDTLIISPGDNTYKINLMDNVSVMFDKIYLYKSNVYTKPMAHYGDGSQWIKFQN